MSKGKQASIGLTSAEKDILARAKKLYEEKTGYRCDWGNFLRVVTDLALGALGILKVQYSNPRMPMFECPSCGMKMMAFCPKDSPPVVHVLCRECGGSYIVAFFEH